MKQRFAETWVLITADKRKAVALTVLLLVAGGLWARMMLLGGKPASASAAQGVTTAGSSDQGQGAGTGVMGGFEARPLVVIPRTVSLTRDLFAPGPAFGSQPLQTDQPDDSGPKSAQGSDDKSPVSPELRRLELERVVREEASRLHLSSTMVGSNPVAVIQHEGTNGERAVLRIGQSIDGFELVEVTARNVVLTKNGIRVELSIGRR